MPQFFQNEPQYARMDGPDASDFLQRLTSVHVRSLQPLGPGRSGAFLNSLGRFESFFRIWKLSDSSFLFQFGEAGMIPDRAAFQAVVDRYTFAEQLEIKLLDGWKTSWSFSSKESAALPSEASDQGFTGEIETSSLPFKLVVRAGSEITGAPDEEAWARFRIENLMAAPGSEITLETSPLEVGMGLAVAENKGCYPGQEVIERTRSLGAPPRRLVLVRAEGSPPSIGQKLESGKAPGSDVAIVTTALSSTPQFLALVRKTSANVGEKLIWKTESGEGSATIEKVASID